MYALKQSKYKSCVAYVNDLRVSINTKDSYHDAYDCLVLAMREKEIKNNPNFVSIYKNAQEVIDYGLYCLENVNILKPSSKNNNLDEFTVGLMEVFKGCKYTYFDMDARQKFADALRYKIGYTEKQDLVRDEQIRRMIKNISMCGQYKIPFDIIGRTLFPKNTSDQYSLFDGQSAELASKWLKDYDNQKSSNSFKEESMQR